MSVGNPFIPLSSAFEPEMITLIDDKKLKKKKTIGRGGMAEVVLCDFDEDGCPSQVVVKTFLSFVRDGDAKRLRSEMSILHSLDHENIVKTYGAVEGKFGFGIVLQYLPNGSYADFFGRFWDKQGKTSELERELAPIKIRLLGEIADAMMYLHGYQPRRILHLDLSSGNVLLTGSLHAKLSDFGLSEFSTLTSLRSKSTVFIGKLAGTPAYIAPERLRQPNFKPTTKCDVYSFGILQYIILSDLPPFSEVDAKLIMHHVDKNDARPDVSLLHDAYPNMLIELMSKCWSREPTQRPTFQEIADNMSIIRRDIRDFEHEATLSKEKIFDCMLQWVRSESTVGLTADSVGETSSTIAGSSETDINDEAATLSLQTQQPGSTISDIKDASTQLLTKLDDSFPSFPELEMISTARLDQINEDDSMTATLLRSCVDETAVRKPRCVHKHILIILSVASLVAVALAAFLIFKFFIYEKNDEIPHNTTAVCPVLKSIGNGTHKCTDGRSMNSVCNYSCNNSHVLKGEKTAICLKTGMWSNPEPTCICPECYTGKNCEFSTSWKKVYDLLWSIGEDPGSLQINYAGYTFTCSSNWHWEMESLKLKWRALCSGDNVKVQCSGWLSSRTAATHAGSKFIRDLSSKQVLPKPCDGEQMDTQCDV